MNYRKFGGMDWEVSALGFGCMRFPVIGGNSSRIEEKAAAEMLYLAIDQGINYIDTGYPYHGGQSESFVGRTLKGVYRDKVKLATKLPSWKIEKTEDFDFYLNNQLERLLTEQIDCYLFHALDKKSWTKIESLGVLDWAEKARVDGRIKHLGFSFHDELSVFKSILDAYQKWDFCMIQYNYMDQDYRLVKKDWNMQPTWAWVLWSWSRCEVVDWLIPQGKSRRSGIRRKSSVRQLNGLFSGFGIKPRFQLC